MAHVAVLLADGFEELEALTPVDVLRRAKIEVDMIGLAPTVTGSHGIPVVADKTIDEAVPEYDMVIVPGGLPGSTNLRDNDLVIDLLQKTVQADRHVAAICAAPIVLDRAGLLQDKHYTCFPGIEQQIESGHPEHKTPVVVDGLVITGRGAGAAFEFAFAILEILGQSSQTLRDEMQYQFVIDCYQEKE